MGSIFPRNTDKANFCHEIFLALTCMLKMLIFCFVISPTAHSLDETLDCSCELILTSPNYPEYYSNRAFKTWNIIAPSQRRILVTFNDFNLEELYDFIDVIDTVVYSSYGKRYTGENIIFPPFLAQGHNLQIKFSSSDSGRRKGFNISVTCSEAEGAFPGRLMDGMSPGEGFLELSSESGEWKRVCEENLSSTVANIICRELGSTGFGEILYVDDTCLEEEKCTTAPSCPENTYRLVDCAREHSVCTSNTSVKVKCSDVGYKGCYDLGSQQLKNSSFFKSKEHCISSCRKDDIGAIAIMNHSECFCSTADEIKLQDLLKISDNGCTSISASSSKMKVYSAYLGFCDELDEPVNGFWDSNITWFGSIVHLTCMDGYRLNGNGTLQCVPRSIPFFPEWNDSTPSCVMEDDLPCSTILLPIFIGSTVVLFLILLAVTKSWIIPQIWKHIPEKMRAESRIIHTYMNARGRSAGADGSVSMASPTDPLTPALTSSHPQHIAEHYENASKTNTDATFYETIPSSDCAQNNEHFPGEDIDPFGYIFPNPRSNFKEQVTLMQREKQDTTMSCKTILDEDGYLVPNACK